MSPQPEAPLLDLDEQFRRFCRDGDTAGLAAVFSALAPTLTRRAMQLTRDPMRAMDLVQATFVTAIETRGRFDVRAKARPWLRGILENKARRRPARHALTEALVAEPVVEDDPADLAMRSELASLVHQAIERLPEPYRAVLRRALLQDETAEQIAAALARPPATVRSQVRRGLERLRLTLPSTLGALLRALGALSRRATIATVATAALLVLAAVASWTLWPPQASSPTPTGPADAKVSVGVDPIAAGATDERAFERLAAAPLVPPAEEQVAPEARLEVLLRRYDDAPLAGVEFAVEWPDGERLWLVTDADGAAIAGRQRSAAVVVEVPFAGMRRRFDLPPTTATSGSPLTIRVPPGFSVAGEVVDASGRPVAAARVLRRDDAGERQVATSDAGGRFLVVDLRAAQAHDLRATCGDAASASARLVGTSGATLVQPFCLDHELEAVAPQPLAADPAATQPLTIEFRCSDGAVVHDWLAVLSKATSGEVIAAQPIAGNVATFPSIPAIGLCCSLLPPDRGASATIDADTQLLVRRHGTLTRPLLRRGQHADFDVHSSELPSAWLRIVAAPGKARITERVVLLDHGGRPHGIFADPAEGIGPIRRGRWSVALLASGREIEYRGPFEVAADGVYAIDDMAGAPTGVLQLRGTGGAPIDPPVERLWVCAADVLLTLDPRLEPRDDLRLAPGDYVLFWQQRGRACAHIALRVDPGEQQVELSAPSGSAVTLEFGFDALGDALGDAAAAQPGRVVRLELTVRDTAGVTRWRERLHAPTDADGCLRATRRFAIGGAAIEAIAADGFCGAATWQDGDEHVRVVMHPPDRPR